MSIDTYNKFTKIRNFIKLNGESYQEYIIKSTNLSYKTKNEILNTKNPVDSLKILCDNQIEFTHNYFDSIANDDANIKLTIIDNETMLIN